MVREAELLVQRGCPQNEFQFLKWGLCNLCLMCSIFGAAVGELQRWEGIVFRKNAKICNKLAKPVSMNYW